MKHQAAIQFLIRAKRATYAGAGTEGIGEKKVFECVFHGGLLKEG